MVSIENYLVTNFYPFCLQRDTHQLLYAILANNASRDAALDFLQEVLVRNVKRQQIQVMERFVAGDGFMLNFLSVMQVSTFPLCSKIFLQAANFSYFPPS